MRSIRVIFEDGNTTDTNINGTDQEILDHYIGQEFQFGDTEECPEDKMVKAVGVVFYPEPNLKLILMQMGNKLVTEHGFDTVGDCLQCSEHITEFTRWVNSVPEAQQCLRELGVEWPMPKF